MLDKVLVIVAIIIFTLNLLVTPLFFKQAPDNTGTFIGLMLVSLAVIRLIDNRK